MVLIKADTFECPDTHTEKFTNQKVYFLGLSPEKSAGRNWNNLLAYKFSLTVSPKLFISVIENVSNVAKLTKSNSFDQKMNLASLPVGGSQEKGGKQTKRFNKWSIGEREQAAASLVPDIDGTGSGSLLDSMLSTVLKQQSSDACSHL